MKNISLIVFVSAILFSCKKEAKDETKTTITYYIKVVEVDADNKSVTETPIATVKITE